MALHRWPTDPKGKAPSHEKTWEAHQAALKAKAPAQGSEVKIAAPGGGFMPVSQWDFGNGKGVLPGGPAQGSEVKIAGPNGTFIPVSEWDFGGGKGVVSPTAAAPAAPEGSMGPLPLPPDASWDDEIAGLGKVRDDTLTDLTGARSRGLLDYGFNEDPASKALTFDPNNPFSRAALLKKNYDTSRASTGLNMGARGQLYAGAYQTAQDNVNRGQLGAEDSLQKSLAGFLANNSSAATRAGTDYELGTARADGSRAARANTNPLYSPTAAATKAPAVAGGPNAPAVPSGPGAAAVTAPPKGVNRIPPLSTLAAGPGIKGTKTKRKGKTVTYSNSTKGP